VEIRLERVRLRKGGRVHLTPRVPEEGPVTTLCGKELKPASFVAVTDAEPDCQACRRRAGDPARVSTALFESGLGEELLQLSLQRAKARREREESRPPAAQPERTRRAPAAPKRAKPEPPAPFGLRGLKPFGEDVYQSPGGVVLRIRRSGEEWELEEVAFEGRALLRRRQAGLSVELGDVRLQFGADGRLRAAFLS
jgi:hypothetical protein